MTSEAVRDLMLYGMLMVSAAGFYAMFYALGRMWEKPSVVAFSQNLHLPHTPHKPSLPPPGGPRPRAWSSRRMTCTTSSGKRTRAAPSLASRQLPFPSTPTQWASR